MERVTGKENRSHFHKYRLSPYKKIHATPRPSVAFAPSSLRSHAKSSGRVKPDYGASNNKEDETLVNDSTMLERQSEPSSDDPLFHWDESATLLSDLMDEKTQDDEEEELDQLAELLQAPITAKGHRKKKEIADVLVGTHNRVRKAFKLLDDNVDVQYGKGAHLFKTASLAIEETYFAQRTAFHEAYQATEAKLEELLDELKEDFKSRDQLWDDLENQMREILLPAIDAVKEAPDQVERTIVKLEKHSKTLESSAKETTSTTRKIVDELMKRA